MKGLILSGGKGTRLYPLTFTLAKQMIPVANKPVLFRVIEAMRDAGVTDVGVVIGPQTGEEIKTALGQGEKLGVNITFIPQMQPNGLAHAVRVAYEQGFLGDDRFVMFLGDNVIEGGIGDLIRDFAHNDWNAQVVLKQVENPSAYGVVKLRDDGSIEKLIEKPKDPPSNLALVGIYMFDHHVRDAVFSIQPSGRNEYEITDAIQWLVNQGLRVYPHVHAGWWFDTGNPIDMVEANSAVLDELLTRIPQEKRLAADCQIENSQVDSRVVVEAGARIINSVVRGPTIIGEHTVIENAFIGPYTSIYHHVTVRDCEVERSIILENSLVEHLPARLQDSLIGRNATLRRNNDKPRVLKMNLGDHSNVWTI